MLKKLIVVLILCWYSSVHAADRSYHGLGYFEWSNPYISAQSDEKINVNNSKFALRGLGSRVALSKNWALEVTGLVFPVAKTIESEIIAGLIDIMLRRTLAINAMLRIHNSKVKFYGKAGGWAVKKKTTTTQYAGSVEDEVVDPGITLLYGFGLAWGGGVTYAYSPRPLFDFSATHCIPTSFMENSYFKWMQNNSIKELFYSQNGSEL